MVVSEWRRVRDERQQRFWKLVTAGTTFSQACEAVGVDRRQGYRWRRASGGRPPSAPRVVSARYLSLEERLQIADLDLAGASMRNRFYASLTSTRVATTAIVVLSGLSS